MDSTIDFESISEGSNPSISTIFNIMAPDLLNSTLSLTSSLCSPYRATITSYISDFSYIHENPFKVYRKGESFIYSSIIKPMIYWSHKNKYNEKNLIYPSKKAEQYVKKLLRKMKNEMCKEGWINHIPNYLIPKVIPLNLRGVRYDGRGWAIKNM
jgi:hypothetical protein